MSMIYPTTVLTTLFTNGLYHYMGNNSKNNVVTTVKKDK